MEKQQRTTADSEWEATPGVWHGTEVELGFTARLPEGAVELRIAAASIYRLYLNGIVTAYGPARAPLGFARVDRIPLNAPPGTPVAVEVAGCATENFCRPKQQPFLKAAFLDRNGTVLGSTGDGKTFRACRLPFRNWKAVKLTRQRDLVEEYDFSGNPAGAEWFRSSDPPLEEVEALPLPHLPRLLTRRAPAPVLSTVRTAERIDAPIPDVLADGAEKTEIYDFGKLHTGFLMLELESGEGCDLRIVWDELLVGGTCDPRRAFWANNFLRIRMAAGQKIELESFEPYALRCAAVSVLSGSVRLKRFRLREYAFDSSLFLPGRENGGLSAEEKTVYAAACETFRQNTADVFMDCPGRERAAWLCDSYFMAETEFFLTGRTDVEDDFLENFILPASYPLPEDWMIPMCFPADNPRGSFLPQWPFWLFLEIFEKKKQRNGMDFTARIRPRLLRYLEGCEKFRGPEGFLENLPGWNFIEWSDAGNFFQDVHFPTNMLYMKCLREAGECYSDDSLLARAETLRKKILDLSFDGEWFHDNAVRRDGVLQRSGNISEIGQYYADFCGVPTPGAEKFERWKSRLLEEKIPEKMVPAAMFIGLVLRFRSLLLGGRAGRFRKECVERLLPMARKTGTLWEKEDPSASCCHGFASVVAVYLDAAAGAVPGRGVRSGRVEEHSPAAVSE